MQYTHPSLSKKLTNSMHIKTELVMAGADATVYVWLFCTFDWHRNLTYAVAFNFDRRFYAEIQIFLTLWTSSHYKIVVSSVLIFQLAFCWA